LPLWRHQHLHFQHSRAMILLTVSASKSRSNAQGVDMLASAGAEFALHGVACSVPLSLRSED
jgi:hypothetical protein